VYLPGIKSTKIPNRTRPINIAIIPVNKESATAISGPVIVGSAETTRVTVCPTRSDITAKLKKKKKKKKKYLV
jgi:hypothetical protein